MEVWRALQAVDPVFSGQAKGSLEEQQVEVHQCLQRKAELDPSQTAFAMETLAFEGAKRQCVRKLNVCRRFLTLNMLL